MNTTLHNRNSGNPRQGSFHVLVKPIGPVCNLECEYCFYLVKKELYPRTGSFRMASGTLEQFTRQYLAGQPAGALEVNIAWQGGEPTLMGVDFFRQAVALQKKFKPPGVSVSNSIQTNGSLLDDEWGVFLSENDFLVGISIDGPELLHDRYRSDGKGRGSFHAAMAGLEVLTKHDVRFNTLTVVQHDNGDHPIEVYDFLKAAGCRFFQFIPLVEPDGNGGVTSRSVRPEQYGRFLCQVFDHWLAQEEVGEVFIQDFDTLLAGFMGLPAPVCVHAEQCGLALALEHNGDLYSCDHYVTPGDYLGNVNREILVDMVYSAKQRAFGEAKLTALPSFCRECEFLRYCNGGCPKDRLSQTSAGEPGLNYLCPGYRQLYQHALPVIEKMAKCIRVGRPARDYEYIEKLIQDEAQAQDLRIGRNDPCPCGSGMKFKRCCGREAVV
ncbi:MAG: anaerobic sulfatase maturase [Fidelibacterota bacterium]|nr:MAG: anaerobic sulfatase maturase [Candidatus Neomarinimicrobiota bacterium]